MAAFRLRKLWRDIHLWIGLTLTIVFVPLGLTGVWLIYDEPLDELLHPHRYEQSSSAEVLAPSRYFAAAAEAFGDRARPAQLQMPAQPGGLATVSSAPGLTAWIDTATAEVVDVGDPRHGVRAFMHQLHGNLFMGQAGRRLVGWLGVAMLAACLTGLFIWWPVNNKIIKALRWRRSPFVWSNLHHAVGFWIFLPLAILSFTGAAIAFPEAVRLVSGAAAQQGGAGRGPSRNVAEPVAAAHLSVDQAVAAAQASAGGARLSQVRLPAAGQAASWQVVLQGQGGQTTVAVDDATGAAAPAAGGGAGARRGPGDPVMRVIRELHEGEALGPVWRVLVVVAGFAPALLGVSGIVLWARRRRLAAS
ncbi:PepSY-associated TM helix domain-containing protein [Phenylobacterium sp.]|uniref:PepSY-associated TM helix domain-containing protein n=1 Tax=Phenylobacterium sp. TaxID=1871053 RepID=UPI0035ADD9FE